MARRPPGCTSAAPPPPYLFTRKTPAGWSGAVIAPLRAYPFLNFLGFKIRPCEEGACTLIDVRLAPQAAQKRTFPNRRFVP
jgi:hypothetical protein